jgi:hypothetical protein
VLCLSASQVGPPVGQGYWVTRVCIQVYMHAILRTVIAQWDFAVGANPRQAHALAARIRGAAAPNYEAPAQSLFMLTFGVGP